MSAAPGSSGGPGSQFTVALATLSLPTATTRAVAFADGSTILLCGGLTAAGTTRDVVQIDPGNAAASVVGRLKHPVHDAAGVTIGGSNLVLGGGQTAQDAFVQSCVASGTGTEVGALPAPRADLGAVMAGNQAIVVGGGAFGAADGRVLATTDGIHFHVIATLPVPVRYAAVAALGDTVFVVGGQGATGDVAAIQVVNVSAGTARIAGQLPAALSHATALVVGGSLLIAGGRHAGRALDTMLAIDPKTFAATSVGTLPQRMSDSAGIILGGVGYLIGGEARNPLASIVTIAPR